MSTRPPTPHDGSAAAGGPAKASEAAAAPAPLGRVGAYELLVELAAGGMATVYLARAVDRRYGAPLVAIKRPHRHLAGDKTFLSMLVDEARLASSIQHENVVRVRELAFDAGVPFIVMDYVEGASLAELRRELATVGRTVDTKVALRIVLDALAGLQAAHELKDETGRHLGIVHRDVSPHNVLIACDGRSHITDFGIAKAEDRMQVTRTHEVKGKLAYLAPERIDKRRICTVQSDVFAMAVVLWECFAGRRLFRGDDAITTLGEVMNAPIPLLAKIGAQLPPALDDVIARALSRDLESRYETAAEFARALERSAGPENVGSRQDVARLMEAIFAERMATRQALVGSAVGAPDLAKLLEESGLPSRASTVPQEPRERLLAELAPPAPTSHYSFADHVAEITTPARRGRLWVAIGIAGGLAAGIGLTALVSHLRAPSPPISAAPRKTPPPPPPSSPSGPRKVIVPLPFAATRVNLDDQSRDLSPPAEVAAFELSIDSGRRHRLTAEASDGTRAEAFVVESDGVARPEGEGFTVALPPGPAPSGDPQVRPAVLRGSSPVGTVKNGFTKLK